MSRRPRAGVLDAAILAVLTLLAVAPLAAMLRHAELSDLVFTGADGPFAADQFQYMAWIRELGGGHLAANRLDTAPSERVFFHPMFALSGLAWAAGVSMALAYLMWKPVALAALFLGFRAYVRRFAAGTGERAAALALALFFATPVGAVWWWGSVGSESERAQVFSLTGESFITGSFWGYLPTAVAVGLMPPFLLGVERLARGAGRAERADRRLLALVTACGITVSWLHPWQGETLLVIVLAAVATVRPWRSWRDWAVLVLPLLGLVGPLAYYFLLSRLDPSWDIAQASTAAGGDVALWIVVLGLAPLALPALLGVRGVEGDLGGRMLLIWPPAAFAVYLALSPSFPQHAFEGISLPLAVLAVRGVAPVRHRALALGALVVALTVPGVAALLDLMDDTVSRGTQAHYLRQGEDDALAYLAGSGQPGAVLATPYLAPLVPVRTGRQTWVAHPSWTEDFDARLREADDLFAGRLPRERALELIRRSRTRYLLRDCGRPREALEALRPALVPERELGCAGVYRVVTG